MTHWVRFNRAGAVGFGTLAAGRISIHSGDMLSTSAPTGESVALGDVELLTPTEPTKIIALWNNFHALAAKI